MPRCMHTFRCCGVPLSPVPRPSSLFPFPLPRTQLVTCVEGAVGPEALAAALAAAVAEHGELLWQDRDEREQRVGVGCGVWAEWGGRW